MLWHDAPNKKCLKASKASVPNMYVYLVDELSVSVVILQEWQEHLKSLGLIENYASLVISQQGL